MATVSLTIFIDRTLIGKTSSIIYSNIVGISWVAYSYFERLVFLFFNILTFLVIILNVIGIFLIIMVSIYVLGDSILRRVVLFFRSNVDDRYISCDITDVYYLNFLIGAILNKMTLFSTL